MDTDQPQSNNEVDHNDSVLQPIQLNNITIYYTTIDLVEAQNMLGGKPDNPVYLMKEYECMIEDLDATKITRTHPIGNGKLLFLPSGLMIASKRKDLENGFLLELVCKFLGNQNNRNDESEIIKLEADQFHMAGIEPESNNEPQPKKERNSAAVAVRKAFKTAGIERKSNNVPQTKKEKNAVSVAVRKANIEKNEIFMEKLMNDQQADYDTNVKCIERYNTIIHQNGNTRFSEEISANLERIRMEEETMTILTEVTDYYKNKINGSGGLDFQSTATTVFKSITAFRESNCSEEELNNFSVKNLQVYSLKNLVEQLIEAKNNINSSLSTFREKELYSVTLPERQCSAVENLEKFFKYQKAPLNGINIKIVNDIHKHGTLYVQNHSEIYEMMPYFKSRIMMSESEIILSDLLDKLKVNR